MKKPRPFNHRPIYTSERRERLAAIEQRARHELGLDAATSYNPENLRGVFFHVQCHAHHTNTKLWRNSWKLLLLIVFLLFLIWKLLL
jgi:hypothetical protein